VVYYCQSYRQRFFPPHQPFVLRSRHARFAVRSRPGTSDWDSFKQVFVTCEYAPVTGPPEPSWVIDCGANVGYASVWFLSAFPSARLVAIEPDPDNYACLVQNLRPYGSRVRTIQGAVWSHDTTLALSTEPYRDGRAWSRQVHPTGTGPKVPAICLDHLLEEIGSSGTTLVKMDIEGTETVLFQAHPEHWLGQVSRLAVELHPDSPFGDPTMAFEAAMQASGFLWSQSGEIVACRRRSDATV
jgi:FkbM family methyltransferase